jgi:hypothetical protein
MIGGARLPDAALWGWPSDDMGKRDLAGVDRSIATLAGSACRIASEGQESPGTMIQIDRGFLGGG